MERVEVYLTPQQHKKFMHHQPFQLSAQQLKASDKHIGKKFHVELQLSKAHYKKLLNNVKAGKGYRFTQEAILGGSILGELWNGAKKAVGAVGDVVNKVGEYIPADMIRQGVKTGLTAGATALGSLVGNPELGLMAAPLIDKGVNFAESGYNYMKGKKDHREAMQDAYDRYAPQARKYVEDRVPMAKKAREMYEEYAPRARKVYRKARRIYYQEPDDDDEDDDDEEDYYEPPPPRRKKASKPHYSAPAPSDYSGYGGRGLKKGSPEMKAKMAKLRAMRKVKGGAITYQNATGQSGGKLKKGSPAMKAKMAKLRAMRKGGSVDYTFPIDDPRSNIDPGMLKYDPNHKPTYDELMEQFWSKGNLNKNYDAVAYGKGMQGGELTEEQKQQLKQKAKDILQQRRETVSKVAHALNGTAEEMKKKLKWPTSGGKIRRRKIKGGWNPFNADDWDPSKNGVGDAFDPNKNGVADVFDPNKNGVADVWYKVEDSLKGFGSNVEDFFKSAVSSGNDLVNQAIAGVAQVLPSEADAQTFGTLLLKELVHRGIPEATAYLCGALAEAILPEATPMSGALGKQIGQQLGQEIAKAVEDKTGYGLRRRRGHRVLLRGGTLHKGVPYPHYTPETEARIRTHGLAFQHKGENGLRKGGSFIPPA